VMHTEEDGDLEFSPTSAVEEVVAPSGRWEDIGCKK
jgi:hypothetical protein